MSRRIWIFILSLLVFSLGIRFYRLDEPKSYYFDEVYHVVTARAIAQNNPDAYNPFAKAPEEGTAYDWLHPPLAKLIQAGSIKILGDNSFAWRLPSAIFGTGIILAAFLLARVLFGTKVAVFASLVMAFENLNLVMSRITMNDVFVTFFILLAFLFATLYVRKSTSEEFRQSRITSGGVNRSVIFLILTGISLGLAITSKWTGVYALAVVGSYLSWPHLRGVFRPSPRPHLEGELRFTSKMGLGVVRIVVVLVVLPVLIYLASYGQFWLQKHSIRQFIDLHKQIWWYQNRSDLKHSYGSTSLYCVPEGLEGPKTFCPWVFNVRPVYFSYQQYGDRAGFIYGLGNPLIFWTGVLAVSFALGKLVETKKRGLFLILAGYFIFWLPWILSPRILFLHHYLPSIPFMGIALGLILAKIWQTKFKFLAMAILAVFALTFFYFYPISTGWPIEPESIDKFMWLPSWR